MSSHGPYFMHINIRFIKGSNHVYTFQNSGMSSSGYDVHVSSTHSIIGFLDDILIFSRVLAKRALTLYHIMLEIGISIIQKKIRKKLRALSLVSATLDTEYATQLSHKCHKRSRNSRLRLGSREGCQSRYFLEKQESL